MITNHFPGLWEMEKEKSKCSGRKRFLFRKREPEPEAYSELIDIFLRDFDQYLYEHENGDITWYPRALETAGIQTDHSMKDIDVSDLDGRTVIAMIIAVMRADRIYEGTFQHFLCPV